MSIVPDVYLLAVDELNDVPAANVLNDDVLSVKPAVSLGDVPCAESLNDKLFVLKFAGAAGVDFIVIVSVSSSSWNIVSGVPDALNLVVYEPADTPAQFLDKVAPIVPAVDPSSTIDSVSVESSLKS